MTIVWLLGVIAIVAAGCASSDAGKAPSAKTDATQRQMPVKLRHYGGPRYPMYPE
jgi:hypothetical protein